MGLPTTILVDNAELNNNKSEGLITDLDVTVSFTRPGRGDDKPFVESTFNSLTAFLPSLSKGHKRAGKLAQRRNDARGQAVFTLGKLRLRSFTAVSVSDLVEKSQNITHFSTFSL